MSDKGQTIDIRKLVRDSEVSPKRDRRVPMMMDRLNKLIAEADVLVERLCETFSSVCVEPHVPPSVPQSEEAFSDSPLSAELDRYADRLHTSLSAIQRLIDSADV